MTAGRVHTSHELGGAAASVITTWPADTAIADIEEAIKAAARDAIRRARAATRANQ